MLGRVWERRRVIVCDRHVDLMLRLGAPLVESFAAVGGRGGKTVLSAIAALEPGPLGLLAAGLTAEVDVTLPPWFGAVGKARVVRALALGCSGDTEALLLETDRTGDSAHMVAVFIDGELGGIAKRLGLTRVLDDRDPLLEGDHSRERGRAAFKPVAVLPACRRVRAALTLTDESRSAPIGEEFIHHRALALARVVNTLDTPAVPAPR